MLNRLAEQLQDGKSDSSRRRANRAPSCLSSHGTSSTMPHSSVLPSDEKIIQELKIEIDEQKFHQYLPDASRDIVSKHRED